MPIEISTLCKHPWRVLALIGCPFAEVLAENNRLNLVPKIAETFEDIIASARGQVKAIITTAEVSTSSWQHRCYVLCQACENQRDKVFK